MQRQCWRLLPKAGNIKNLKLVDEEIDDPNNEEVQIKIKAIGLNFADIFAIFGLYGATPEGSFVPGLEYSGEVIKVGANVSKFKIGDKVIGITKFGGYASVINIESTYITPLPNQWTFEQGAAYLVQVLTAYWALIELARIKRGETVLIHSAAGGVGLWANRIAKQFNAYTIGSIGTASKSKLLIEEGYDDYIVRDSTFRNKLTEKLKGRNLDIILDCIGGKILKAGYSILTKNGRMIIYGSARYAQPGNRPNYLKLILKYITRPKIDPQKMTEQNKLVAGFNLIYLYEMKERFGEILKDLQKYDLGTPVVGHVFEMEELPKAIRLFQTGKTTGKVVVRTEKE